MVTEFEVSAEVKDVEESQPVECSWLFQDYDDDTNVIEIRSKQTSLFYAGIMPAGKNISFTLSRGRYRPEFIPITGAQIRRQQKGPN